MNGLLFLIPDYIDQSHNFIEIFGFQIYYYAIAITFGMLACVFAVIPLFKRRGMKTDFLLDLMIGIIPCSIICARLWYVLFDIKNFHSFKEVIDIRSGGMAIYGGVAGGALGIVIVCLIEKKPITKIFDFGAVMLPLGQAIGRWGNYFNQEVYGAVDPRSIGFPVSVYIQDAGEYHYALFFWESVANIILFALLYWFLFKYKGKRNGYATSFYFMGYGVIRAVMEPLRDAQYNLPLFGSETLGSEWASILLILGGLALFVVLFVRDFRDNGKNFKKYFAYMFGERRASEKAENTVRHEAKTDDGEKTSLSVRSVKNLKPSHRSESTVETRETADGEENEEEEAILTALDDDGDL